MFEEEMKKVLVFIKGFTPIERTKLARMTALWVANGAVPPTVLAVLNNEHLIKDGVALEFLLELFVTLKQERGIPTLITVLKKGSLEARLMEFLPLNKRTDENFKSTFSERGLEDIVKLHKAQASQELKRELQSVSRKTFLNLNAHGRNFKWNLIWSLWTCATSTMANDLFGWVIFSTFRTKNSHNILLSSKSCLNNSNKILW